MNRTMQRFTNISLLTLAMVGNAQAAILETIAPDPFAFTEGVHFSVMAYSAPGDVAAPIVAVDLQLGFGNTSTSGCDAADFSLFTAGGIALMQRGFCPSALKAENAAAAGAIGALIFNQGDTLDRVALFSDSLGPGYTGGIPVMSLSYIIGLELNVAAQKGFEMHMLVDEADIGYAPVPGTVTLLGLGLAGLGIASCRRKVQAA